MNNVLYKACLPQFKSLNKKSHEELNSPKPGSNWTICCSLKQLNCCQFEFTIKERIYRHKNQTVFRFDSSVLRSTQSWMRGVLVLAGGVHVWDEEGHRLNKRSHFNAKSK